MSSSARVSYWPELDGLRALAFLMVFFYHLGPRPGATGILARLWSRVVLWGWAGVDVFFVLSAFLITYLLVSERDTCGDISFRRFFTRRMLRIWPLYYLFLGVGFLLLPTLGMFGPTLGTDAWHQVVHRYGLPFVTFTGNFSLLHDHQVPALPDTLTALWSISVEEQFYIGWCLILTQVSSTRAILGILGAGFLLSLSTRYLIHLTASDSLAYCNFTLSRLDPIVLGAVVGTLVAREKLRPQTLEHLSKKVVGGAIVVWGLLVLAVPPVMLNRPSAVLAMSGVALGGTLLLLGILISPRMRRFFSNPLLVAYGRITYGLYIFHLLGLSLANWCLWKFNPFSTPTQYWMAQLVLGLPITSLLAILSWNLYESPFNRMRHRFSRVG